MKFTPRDFQIKAAAAGTQALQSGKSLAIVSPTGSGKSLVLALLLEQNPEAWLTVPTLEIGASVYDKIHPGVEADRDSLRAARIVTAKEYLNRLMAAECAPPKFLLHDEIHHSTDDTHELIHALAGHCPRVGVTATYFRGTPDETLKLRKMWGEPHVALTLREASERGIVSIPAVSVWPLLNDETLKVSNGEFETKSVEGAIEKQVPVLIDRVKEQLYDRASGLWARPTIFTLPGVSSARSVTAALNASGLPAVAVVGGTHDRQAAFASVLERRQVLVHVNVVAEGIDLPLRVSVDLAPTMSPVRFMQGRLGRTMRPVPIAEALPDYICTNHNVTRFSYLLAGLIPREQIKKAQQAWGPEWKPSRRHMARALGLEGFGRFTVSSVPLQDGTLLSLYALQTSDGLSQYCVLLLPDEADPYYFRRTNVRNGQMGEHRLPDGKVVQYPLKDYGRWQRIDSIPSADGYVSVKPQPITPNMRAWWEKSAPGRGLDASFSPDARQFTVLPVLLNAGIRFK